MFFIKILLPLIASVQNPLMIEEVLDPEDQVVVLEDPAELYEIEFNEDEEDSLEIQ